MDKIVWPAENKEKLEKILKKKGLFKDFAIISYPKLNSQVSEGNIPKIIESLSTREKDYRVNLSNNKKPED